MGRGKGRRENEGTLGDEKKEDEDEGEDKKEEEQKENEEEKEEQEMSSVCLSSIRPVFSKLHQNKKAFLHCLSPFRLPPPLPVVIKFSVFLVLVLSLHVYSSLCRFLSVFLRIQKVN